MIVTVLVSLLCVGASCGAPSSTHPHRHGGSRGRVAHLQETVDRLLLRQRTDHILITNLQAAVEKLQRTVEGPSVSPGAEGVVELVEKEGRVLAELGDQVAQVHDTLTEAVTVQQDRDQVFSLRQEVQRLKSEVRQLRVRGAAGSSQQQRREEAVAAWASDSLKHLQDNVAELQQAINVSQALHDKREVEGRVSGVSRDVAAMRGSVAAATSRAEEAVAAGAGLQEEVTRLGHQANTNAGGLAALTAEVSAMRQDFNDLLAHLPEGTMAGVAPPPAASTPAGSTPAPAQDPSSSQHKECPGHDKLSQRLSSLERRTDDLDFALTRTQIQVSKAVGCEARLAEVSEGERQLEVRVEAVSEGVAEVRLSSVQLLAALAALEEKVEKGVAEVRAEVAKLEFNDVQETAEHQGQAGEARQALDDAAALRTDLEALYRRVNHLTVQAAAGDATRLEGAIKDAECHLQHTALNAQLRDANDRIKVLEDKVTQQGRHRGHHAKLQPWDALDHRPQGHTSP